MSSTGNVGTPLTELTSFVGRADDLAEGRRLLGAARLVTMVGPGGVGKTRLARQLVDRVSRAFPDGTFVVALEEALDADEVAPRVAAALGVHDVAPSPGAAVAACVRERQLLLVLDGCEHLADDCARLVGDLLQQAPGLRVLATSRRPLEVAGEQLMPVAPLSLPPGGARTTDDLARSEAVSLLVERARLVAPGFRVDEDSAELVGRLCTKLDGLPLAIELAAARLHVLSPSQLVERLHGGSDVLGTGPAGTPARRASLRASLDWSFGLCSAHEQMVWERMSVFRGGADLDAAEAVCGEPGESVFDAVVGLVDKSVLTPREAGGRVRYAMLETTREYGLGRLAERGEAHDVRARHRDYFVQAADRTRRSWFGPGQRALLTHTGVELGNLSNALDFSLSTPETLEQALTLTAAMSWYWPSTGRLEEGRRWSQRTLARRLEASPAALHALSTAACLAAARGDQAEVRDYGERALGMAGDGSDAARSDRRRVTSLLLAVDGDHEAALAEDVSSLTEEAAVDRLGPEARVEVLTRVATRLAWLGRAAEALDHVDAAVRLCRDARDEWYLGYLLHLRGACLDDLGRHHEAAEAGREALRLASGLNASTLAVAIEAMARSCTALGEGYQAAVLLGALGGSRTVAGDEPADGEGAGRAADVKRALELLGESAFDSAYDEGRAMSLDDAAAFVLGEHGGVRPTARPAAERSEVRLSNRELDVAEMIARGLSNKEIALALLISPRTAEGHVTRLLQKLGFGSRSMVASWVAERRASR